MSGQRAGIEPAPLVLLLLCMLAAAAVVGGVAAVASLVCGGAACAAVCLSDTVGCVESNAERKSRQNRDLNIDLYLDLDHIDLCSIDPLMFSVGSQSRVGLGSCARAPQSLCYRLAAAR